MRGPFKLGAVLFFFLGAFFGYIALGVFTEIRIDKLRPFITKRAVDEGVQAGVEEYKKQMKEEEPVRIKKRQIRDRIIKEYLERISQIMEANE